MRWAWPLVWALVATTANAAPRAPLTTLGFEAKLLDGSRVSAADIAGQPLIINFWATWCAPCRAEMPAFDAWLTAHPRLGVRMIAISMDDGAKRKLVQRVAAGFQFPVAMARDVQLPRGWQVSGIPVTLVFDRTGAIAFDSRNTPSGLVDQGTLNRVMTPLLR